MAVKAVRIPLRSPTSIQQLLPFLAALACTTVKQRLLSQTVRLRQISIAPDPHRPSYGPGLRMCGPDTSPIIRALFVDSKATS